MKAAILAIGTELTTGQITNKNAAHLSALLKDLGISTLVHLTVPDDHALILDSLESTAQKCDLLITTGGLGPTSDDFTRDVVAQWLQLPLAFDQESWEMLSERLTSRGYTVKDIQRQQCYFPTGAKILKNSEGTANGFYIPKNQKHLFVLPGPPREIDAIWNGGMKDLLLPLAAHLDPIVTFSWDTLGVGESDVAMMVNEVLDNGDHSANFEIGYRVHLPYVEVKLSFLRSQIEHFKKMTEELEQKLSAITVTRNGADIVQQLGLLLSRYAEIQILDEVSGTFLLNRMLPLIKKISPLSKVSWSNGLPPTTSSGLQLKLNFHSPLEAKISCHHSGQNFEVIIDSPYQKSLMQERRRQYFAERALIQWCQFLQD